MRKLIPVLCLVFAQVTAFAQESEPHQPNILVIISDDQGVVDSPEYHYDPSPPYTPNLSALANEGVIFENAWATPMCFTTRAAYLTGLHGTRNGVLTGGVPIRSEPTVIQGRQAKSTLYAGGLHVPFFASGAGVTRKGVREDRLVTITDIFMYKDVTASEPDILRRLQRAGERINRAHQQGGLKRTFPVL